MKVLFCLVILSAIALGAISPISLRVEQISKDQTEKFTHKQDKSLKVVLTNSSAQDLSLKVKCVYFTRDVKTHEVAAEGKGEVSADLKSHTTATVETPAFSTSYTEEHSTGKGGGGNSTTGNAGGATKSKKVEASGKRFVGYGVQVFNGDTLVGEYFSEPSLKAQAGN